MNLLVPEKINIKEKISRQEEPRTVPILSNQSSNWFICLPTCMYWVTSICRYFTRYSNDKQDRQEAHILTVFCQKKKKKDFSQYSKEPGPRTQIPCLPGDPVPGKMASRKPSRLKILERESGYMNSDFNSVCGSLNGLKWNPTALGASVAPCQCIRWCLGVHGAVLKILR